MSKNELTPEQVLDCVSKEVGFLVNGYKMNKFQDLVGKLLTLSETLGLPENQETAFKSLLKQTLWDFWDSPQYSYTYNLEGELEM